MIGQRGVPATYGGIERHVEELGARLVARGHRVTVFTRRGYAEPAVDSWRGMDVRLAASVPTKHLEAITHSAASVVAAARMRPDVMHFHAVGPGLVSPAARRISRAAIVQTIHGLDADRSKWGGGAARMLRYAERLSARVSDETIVVSQDLGRHYAEVHHRQVAVVANGVEPPTPAPVDVLPAEPGSILVRRLRGRA